ncbi:RidA family protein [Pseudonocardiaceae bacterium YIM PH 21723]|nr:RidA family protein [Pseudonocardiaceae bacterium YIM PH 21723]
MPEFHQQPAGLPPTVGYSHAVSATGTLIVISGQVPLDENGVLVGEHDPEEQIRQVFRNVRAALAAANAGMEHLIKITIFVTDLADLAAFRRVRDEFVDTARPPASSLVQVSGLVDPRFRIEVEGLAVL